MSNTTATELIARMRALYASVHTYADRGTASTILGPRVTFQTSFTRGHRLRFEFGREHQSRVIWSVNKEHDWTVIWSDGEHTYTHWTLAARIGEPELIDDGRDIGGAIAAARHMSSLSASTVPALLLPVSVGSAFSTLAEISELNHDRDEYIGRTVCARIDTHHAVGGGATLWIERETCLLRRILTTRASGLGTTIDYEPSLHPIDVGNMERPDVEKMQPQPRKPRPWTGIGFENISRRVARMEPGSPASRSSLAIGDEVEAVNGHPTDRLTDFLDALREVSVGEQVTLTIRRGGNTQEILMQVEAAPPRVTPSPSSPLVE
jgi:hypothetical protein